MTWFARTSSRRERDALLDYWDEVIDQSPATPVPPVTVPDELGALVRAVHVADAINPDHPAYEDRLLRALLARQKEIAPMNATAATAPPLSPPGKPIRTTKPRRHAEPVGRSARPAFIIALVVLLIFASAAGIWFAGNRHDEPHRMMAPDIATPGADASPDVPMYRANPERTGVMPGPGIDGQPVELWQAVVEGPVTYPPSLVDGLLYLGAGDGGVHAVDAATGEMVWTFDTGSPISSTPAIHNGIVIVGSEDGLLHAIDVETGTEVWTAPGARAQASVAIAGDTVYAGGLDGFLYALDVATGEERWSAPLDASASRSPAVSNGVVYQGSADGVLHTFDAETGEPGWAVTLDGDGTIATTVVTGGVVYQGTFEGAENAFFALDATTGEELWRFNSESGSGFYTAVVGRDTVYTPTGDGVVYALDAATGEPRWQVALGVQFSTAPSLVGDTLYTSGNNGVVYVLDADTGIEQWQFTVEGAVSGGVIVSGGVAYFGTSFGYLYAFGGSGESMTAAPGGIATPAATPAATPVEPASSTPVVSDRPATFAWQSTGGDVEFAQPWDLTIAPDETIWLADGEHHQFQIFTPAGEWVESWGGLGTGSGDGEFNFTRPNSEGDAFGAVAFAQDGSFYVADMGNQRIQHFGADRQFLHAWGGFGPGDGQFLSPNDVAVDSQGNVYVVDAIRGDTQKFTADGEFLLAFGNEENVPGQLNSQYLITIDADDHIWLPRGSDLPVEEWDADGNLIARHDLTGTVGYPVGIAFDGSGRMFVVDAAGARVVVFDSSLSVIGQWGERGDGPGQFQQPQTIALDGDGNAYVADYYNGLQKFEVTVPAMPGATPAA